MCAATAHLKEQRCWHIVLHVCAKCHTITTSLHTCVQCLQWQGIWEKKILDLNCVVLLSHDLTPTKKANLMKISWYMSKLPLTSNVQALPLMKTLPLPRWPLRMHGSSLGCHGVVACYFFFILVLFQRILLKTTKHVWCIHTLVKIYILYNQTFRKNCATSVPQRSVLPLRGEVMASASEVRVSLYINVNSVEFLNLRLFILLPL